jgi:transcriptional regulator with XRE-family HTH domain
MSAQFKGFYLSESEKVRLKLSPGAASMHFAEKLRNVRKEKGWTQLELAKRMGISNTFISQWELGRSHPSLDTFAKLVRTLGVSADYFLFENIPREGVAAINDFELYEYFRKTERLPKEKKEWIKGLVNAVVFQEKVSEIPEADPSESKKQTESVPLRKVAGKR